MNKRLKKKKNSRVIRVKHCVRTTSGYSRKLGKRKRRKLFVAMTNVSVSAVTRISREMIVRQMEERINPSGLFFTHEGPKDPPTRKLIGFSSAIELFGEPQRPPKVKSSVLYEVRTKE